MNEERKFKGSLKLDWINKDKSLYYEIDETEGRGIKPVWVDKEDIRVSEPRILNFVKSYGEEISENMLIRGDNLLVLRTLVEQFKNREEKDKVKCIYIDPPYNTGNAFDKYDDNLKHSEWLTMMRDRLILLKKLLRKDGVIFIQVDDKEQAYLKILMDEIFGRENFVNCIAIKMSEASGVKMNHSLKRFPKIKEYILFYKMQNFNGFFEIDKYKNSLWDQENNIFLEKFTKEHRNELIKIEEKEENDETDLKKAIEILKEVKKIPLSQKINELNIKDPHKLDEWKFENSYRIIKTAGSSSLANLVKEMSHLPKQEISASLSKNKVLFFYITDFNRNTKQPRLQVIFSDSNIYKNPCDFWQDIKTTGAIAEEGGVQLEQSKKPEKILYRIIKMCTKSNDWVLDSFAGSGTTGAVAHKMKRRWIMVELGKHAEDLCIKRMQNVINGDNTGVSGIINWQGGGGFKYYKLGESLISNKDINWNLTYEQIAEALFYTKNFKLIDNKEMKKKKIFFGENRTEKGVFAVCSISKDLEFIRSDEYFGIIDVLKKIPGFKELNIYTNKAVNIRKEDQPEDVFIRKIPQTILKKYKLL